MKYLKFYYIINKTMKEQTHLNHIKTINYGSFYTPTKLVDIVYNMIHKNIKDLKYFKFIDTSCGYGSFLRYPNSIGADYDEKALLEAKKQVPQNCILINTNSLKNVNRSKYKLLPKEKIIIIGNPPYNDTSSIIRNKIKSQICSIDEDLKRRDLGLSFLLSYAKLNADYICVLHPLSYLIKKTNFESLNMLTKNYILLDDLIVSSGEFSATSKTTHFPIIIALYQKSKKGMTYKDIQEHVFKTIEGKSFSLNKFDTLNNYVTKYPNHNSIKPNETIAFFWTMRDINALKRTKTFIEKENYNSIRVAKNNLVFYCYADIFKEYIQHIPYYFGNCEIMINLNNLKKLQDYFLYKSLRKYPFLSDLLQDKVIINESDQTINLLIDTYFKDLLGEHYVDNKIGQPK